MENHSQSTVDLKDQDKMTCKVIITYETVWNPQLYIETETILNTYQSLRAQLDSAYEVLLKS